MSQVPDPLAALWPVVPSATADWLRELTADDGLTGFLPPPLPDAAWVLNAMYEAVDSLAPSAPGAAPGGGLGRTRHPGPGWRRLRWAELSCRTGDPTVPEGLLPSYRCFPSARKNGSWPLTLSPPTEGSLDRETWTRLIDILTEHSPAGADTRCLAYYSPLVLGAHDFDTLHVRAGRLGDAQALYDDIPDADFSPSNLWAEDHSWVTCTDYDLWATKVAGPAPLIDALLSDPEIEAIRLPWSP
ncbi:hypothetical protein [Actinacidiphila bryophytorum]|uniref:hypothetical protein n=1 Tax=Actinacidiphila bryophytorum TaxID=1436133 RepID=UPI002176C5F7|nr:hypothetical protein [Actinacidiphila bryophytorum]UWE07572.1 hypothetical protein NYE86_01685 [Actinacidiphila bryophytorum]